MRKLLTTVSAVAIAGVLAYSVARTANLPLISGITNVDPAAEQAVLNALIQSINAGVTGNYAFTPGPVGNTGSGTTTANITLASATIPTGAVLSAGQGYRARCSGISTVTTTAKYGITVGRSMAVSLESVAGEPINGFNWDLELQFQAATTPATANYVWMGRALAGSTSGTASGAIAAMSGNDTTVTDNNTNLSLPVTCVMYGGAATGFVTMMNFAIEQLR